METGFTRRGFLGAALVAWPGMMFLAASGSSPAMGWKLGIIADEISEDFNQALDFITHYSLHYCELREMWRKNVMNLSQAQLDQAKKLIERHRHRRPSPDRAWP